MSVIKNWDNIKTKKTGSVESVRTQVFKLLSVLSNSYNVQLVILKDYMQTKFDKIQWDELTPQEKCMTRNHFKKIIKTM